MRESQIFDAAMEIAEPIERSLFLDSACQGNLALKEHLARLIASQEQLGNFLDSRQALVEIATEVLTESVPTAIGPYRLLRQIGEGGMGTVFLAEQTQPVSRQVAVKIVKPGMDCQQVIVRLEAERQALALMEHPNIAKILDAGTFGATASDDCQHDFTIDSTFHPKGRSSIRNPLGSGRPYFVMELVNGEPITRFCDLRRLSVRRRVELFVPVCQALHHAHQKGVIHRDVKPSNVLVTDYNGRPVPKVIDFGVAKAIGAKLTESTLSTQLGQVVGTVEYMSPEQAKLNAVDIDTRSDIYSLGVLLYELLTGATPLNQQRGAQTPFDELLRIVREDDASLPSKQLSNHPDLTTIAANRGLNRDNLCREVCGELDWIVMKCLEKDRGRRYESADHLTRDLECFLRDEPVDACPPSFRYRCGKFVRKNRGWLIAALAFVVMLTIASTVSTYLAIRATLAERVLEMERDRADAEAFRARRQAYIACMNLGQNAWEEARIGNLLTLLERQRPDPGAKDFRGFEWHYLHRLTDASLRVFKAHTAQITKVAFSPDGTRIASASYDRTVKLWDARGGPMQTLTAHAWIVFSLAFSPDGTRIITGGADRTVKIWDLATGNVIRTLNGHQDLVTSVTISSDGKRVASCSRDGTVRIWQVDDGAIVQTLQREHAPVHDVAFSPDAKLIASCSTDSTVRLWDVESGQIVSTLAGHHDNVTSLKFSPDGKWIVSASLDHTLKLWEVASGVEVQTLRGHSERIFGVDFSPDGTQIASASFDQTIKVWDRSTGNERFTLTGHTSWLSSIAFSSDGRRLVSASEDGTIRIWSAVRNPDVLVLKGHRERARGVTFSPDGQLLASCGDDHLVRLWDVKSGLPAGNLHGHQEGVFDVSFSPDGNQIASCSADRTVKLWDTFSREEIRTLIGATARVRRVAFRPDGKQLAAAADDGMIRIWETGNGTLRLTLKGHTGQVSSVAYSRDGKSLASGGEDKTIRIWDAQSGDEIQTLNGHSNWVERVVFSQDGQWIASASGDKTIKLWNRLGNQKILSLEGHNRWVSGLVFSPDRKRIASSGADGVIRLWDTDCGQELMSLKGHIGIVSGIAFSPAGDLLASSGYDGRIRVFNSHEWTPTLRIEQEARDLIESFRDRFESKQQVIESMTHDLTVSDDVRQVALKMTQRWVEDLHD